jgi:OOP family OmpA-OmpF porin
MTGDRAVTTGSKPNFAARRLAGAVVAALAVVSGTALAQSQPGYVTSGSGNSVMTNYGECWRGGAAPQGLGGCPPAAMRTSTAAVGSAPERTQLAQSGARERAQIAPSAPHGTPASAGAGAGVMEQGYVNSPEGINYRTAYGQCWRSGSWTPNMASEPAPIAQAAPEPRGPLLQKITLETDVLFGFDRAELRDEGRQKLDEIADGLKDAQVNEIVAIGHTDRIGSESYNAKLSERRAGAVKEYLVQKGVSQERIVVEGQGEQSPVTGGDCSKVKGQKLIQCFQPDRRVEIEVFGTREVAATGEQPAAGATSGQAGSSSSGSAR